MPPSCLFLAHCQNELISHISRNRGKPRTKGNPCKAGNVKRARLSGLIDHLVSVSLTSPWRSWHVPVSMTQYCLQDLPKQPSFHSWLQRFSPPSLWDLGPAVLASFAILVTGIIIAIIASKPLMLSWYLDLGEEKGRGGERRASCVQVMKGMKNC